MTKNKQIEGFFRDADPDTQEEWISSSESPEQADKRLKRQLVIDYYDGKYTRATIESEYKLSFSTLRRHFKIRLEYDKKHFMKIIETDYLTLGKTAFMEKHLITRTAYEGFEEGYGFMLKVFVKWLKRLEVKHKLIVKEGVELEPKDIIFIKLGKEVIEESEVRKDFFRLSVADRRDFVEKIRLIESQREELLNILRDRKFSVEFIRKIDDRLSVLLRLTLAIGVDTEKKGYGDRAIRGLLIKQGIL